MNDAAHARSFAAQLADIHRDMLESWHAETPDAGLVEWAAFRSDTRFGISFPDLALTQIPPQRWAEAPILAAVGYRLPLPAISESEETAGLWLDGMHRLMARDPVPADRNSFFFRPVELLGLAVGSQTLAAKDDAPQTGCAIFSRPEVTSSLELVFGPQCCTRWRRRVLAQGGRSQADLSRTWQLRSPCCCGSISWMRTWPQR